ncbi:hypothetical protein SAY87_018074 [Trapa incisa]|uniref:Response regulatory domain-containing protein n=1 Tax=Trapa incisa TaxID=236973 RepID=A0AAN7QTG0_9MYRT|nr:hypothetical protein SAY87_018074 [Trapa incisa]
MARNGAFPRRRASEGADWLDLCQANVEEAHVLAVDDSLVDRKVIERLLKISSFKVTAVDSGLRALQFLGLDGKKSPIDFHSLKVDLIITDYCMPGMTGYELLKRIKGSSALREIPVVVMSSENVVARIDRCLEEGAEDFIVKPVKLSDVRRLKDYMVRGCQPNSGGKNHQKRKQLHGSATSSSSPLPSVSSSRSRSPLVDTPAAPCSPSSLESPTRRLRMTSCE